MLAASKLRVAQSHCLSNAYQHNHIKKINKSHILPPMFSRSTRMQGRLSTAALVRARNQHADDGRESESTDRASEPEKRPEEDPSSRGHDACSDEADGSAGLDPRQRRSFLRRIAVSFAGIFAGLSPARIRSFFSSLITPQFFRLTIYFVIGIGLSMLGALTSRRSLGGHRGTMPQEVVYSEFLRLITSGNVRAARFEDGTGRILFDALPHSSEITSASMTAKSQQKGTPALASVTPQGKSRTPRQFYTRHLPDPQLVSTLMAAGVEFGSVRASLASAVSRVFAMALALWIPLIPMFILMRRFMEGKNGNKRSRKGSSRAEVPPTTFADVAGVGAAKEELQEVVACLKDSRKFSRLGAKLPSGVLLCGPPGTGKTLLAKAVAGEAGVPFLAVSASEFVELFVGRGAARIRELFSEARRRSPCVVFIDELDAVGGKRGAGLNEERDQTLNQLLTELDGFDGRPGVLLLAATNRADVLDHALLRPGRLSRKVNVPLPDTEGRAAILAVHLRHVPLQGGPSAIPQAADLIARITNGFSGAELANVVNEAAFLAARRDGSSLELADLADAVSRTRYGVNGGDSGAGSLVRKMQSWLGDSGATDKKMITQPLGS